MSTPFAQAMAKRRRRPISTLSPVVGEIPSALPAMSHASYRMGEPDGPRGAMEEFSARTWAEGGQGISLSGQVSMCRMAVIVGGVISWDASYFIFWEGMKIEWTTVLVRIVRGQLWE